MEAEGEGSFLQWCHFLPLQLLAEQQLREEAERKQAEEEAKKSQSNPEEEKEGDDAGDESAGFERGGEEARLSQGALSFSHTSNVRFASKRL